eukprot:m.41713 g.41713  ORF g.41713 m.41713 type:complete len:125 (+) comp14963_c0_seq1:66-440(+)
MFALRKAVVGTGRLCTSQARAMSQVFARTTTFVLAKPAQKPEMDAILKEYLESTTYKMEGSVGADRYYCGGQHTYRVNTFWNSLESLKASNDDELLQAAYAQALPFVKDGADGMHTQLFMYDKF